MLIKGGFLPGIVDASVGAILDMMLVSETVVLTMAKGSLVHLLTVLLEMIFFSGCNTVQSASAGIVAVVHVSVIALVIEAVLRPREL